MKTVMLVVAGAGILVTGLTLAASSSTAEKVSFEQDVWPILESRCVECHGPPKKDTQGRLRGPKAGLRVDGRGYIESGSNTSDRIVVPGMPERSLMYTLTALPEGDLDIMPSKGKPLTAEQIETIRVWIAGGASYGDWTGSGGPKRPIPRKKSSASLPNGPPVRVLALLRELGKDVAPLARAKTKDLCDGLARVEPVFPGSPLLRVVFTSNQRSVRDEHVKALRAVADHVAHLDLSKTPISGSALASLKTLPRLVRLDLHGTAVDDAGLAKLAPQPELRSLVLTKTKISDASVERLASLESLTDVYLWGSAVTSEGIERLRAALPGAKVRGEPEFPEPEEGAAPGRRRRN